MDLKLKHYQNKIFILGAGASVDYCLPTWKELADLLKEKMKNDTDNHFKYRNDIIRWLDKVGHGKEYKTIDECINYESRASSYRENGTKIENEIFQAIIEIFEERYDHKEENWIKILNDKIRDSQIKNLEDEIAFINYNYDDILNKNFLNFNSLCEKDKLYHHDRINRLSAIKTKCLYPHGNFSTNEPENIIPFIDTFKTDHPEHVDAVSCHESKQHNIQLINKQYNVINTETEVTLYILGLGSGLEINLNNIFFKNPVNKIHITIKNKNNKNKIINYLSEKFKIDPKDIEVHEHCINLINNCFIPKF